jgi:fatty acid desaturase
MTLATSTTETAVATGPVGPTGPMGAAGAPRLSSRLTTGITERRHVPKHSGKPDPTAHLSAEQVDALARELDAIRKEVFDSRGAADAAYIRAVIKAQRTLELASRGVLLFSLFPPAWVLGTVGLSVAKILENMEIGHNVMHGQWDWMRDPRIHSTAWEWDNASPSELWKHSHNELHHTFTNVLGRDNDLGYGIMRVDEDQPWHPMYLGQPVWNFLNACFFEYGIAAYDCELGAHLRDKATDDPVFRANVRKVLGKIRKQATKDYVVHPLLSGPSFLHTVAANAVANLVRNVWTHSVIMCGHFPEGVETFAKESIDGETRGEWYLRQMTGSANIHGSKAMHLMTGNLSHQIEHHLFPDMPSNRYAQIAPRIREISQRYGLSYTTGTLPQQVFSAWKQVVKLSLPNGTTPRSLTATAAASAAGRVRRSLAGVRSSLRAAPAARA